MKCKLKYTTAIMLMSLLGIASASASPLIELKGQDSKGNAVDLAVTTESATAFGLADVKTKLVSQGDAVRTVTGIEIRKFIAAQDLQGNNLHVTALDGYEMDLPRADIDKYPVLLGFLVDGQPLSVRQKGPTWIIYPVSDYKELDDPAFEARSVWQLKSIEINKK
jgi:hypothetical protein